MITNKKIIIAGGAGFIGSHLSIKLAQAGNQVIILDNLYTGRLSNIASICSLPQVTFINHDICNPIDIHADIILNFACPASPPHYQKDPIFTTKTNVLGTLQLLELAKKYDALFLQASTSEVYGDPEAHPQRESYRGSVNPHGIRACYDEGKRCAESLIFDFHRMYGTRVKIVRIFNTYGPLMDPQDGRVVSNFITQALAQQPLTLYGDGRQTRSFCYIDDLVAGIFAMLTSPNDFTGPVNLGNPHEFTMSNLAKLILGLTGSSSSIIIKPLPQDDPARRLPDISRARHFLGWEPSVPLPQGLIKTIAYFQELQHSSSQFLAAV